MVGGGHFNEGLGDTANVTRVAGFALIRSIIVDSSGFAIGNQLLMLSICRMIVFSNRSQSRCAIKFSGGEGKCSAY